MSVEAKAARIKLILFDVDGVLTDGRVVIHADGTESKTFGIRDGIAMVWAQRSGIRVGFLSARFSATTPHRAAQLGITLVHQGVTSKLDAYERILADEGLDDDDVAYMADDIVDLSVLARSGLSAAPADAVADVRSRVDWVSGMKGGGGAARELIELILRAQDRWDAIVVSYEGEQSQSTRPVLDLREGSARGPSERARASEASGGGAPRAGGNAPSASSVGVGPHAGKK